MDIQQRILNRMVEIREIFTEYISVLHIPHFITSGCNVPYLEAYTTGAAPSLEEQVDSEIINWRIETPCWLTEERADALVTEFVKFCVALITPEGFTPYGVGRLPSIDDINQGQIVQAREVYCKVIRCRSPSDFHIIFSDNLPWFDLTAYNDAWLEFFRLRILAYPSYFFGSASESRSGSLPDQEEDRERFLRMNCFQSPFELFQGVRHVLPKLVEYVRTPGGLTVDECRILEERTYFPGDLVVVTKRDMHQHRTWAYRAVIVEPVIVLLDLASQPVSDCFLVYLLETGEKRVVAKKTLLPLPRPFVCFRPLAVRCSLARLAPAVGNEGWTEQAVATVRHIFSNTYGDFVATYLSRMPYLPSEDLRGSRTLELLDKLAYSMHFSVNLIEYDRPWNNVTSLLVRQGLGIMGPVEPSPDDEDSEDKSRCFSF